jgi:hypothetical protein
MTRGRAADFHIADDGVWNDCSVCGGSEVKIAIGLGDSSGKQITLFSMSLVTHRRVHGMSTGNDKGLIVMLRSPAARAQEHAMRRPDLAVLSSRDTLIRTSSREISSFQEL